ncbi:hypothetical protein M569_14485, partial [Genlisea aurea]
MEWAACLDEYEKLQIRMSTPRVVIDNVGCSDATRLLIDRARKHGFLLEAIQVLTDLNLSIRKAYICSDGRWFMDVFHVTDLNGNKLTDDAILGSIEKSLVTVHYGGSRTFQQASTVLELTGSDRVGLLSEIFAVLFNQQCNVVDAKVWTNNGRVAALIYITDESTGFPVVDSEKLSVIEGMLRNVLKGADDIHGAKTRVSLNVMIHAERRLHQLMFNDRDYETKNPATAAAAAAPCRGAPVVSVKNYLEKDYSVVNIHCSDRNKLLFDVVCTLTDMEYSVFHATVDTSENVATLEFFIRHMDGTPISSDAEKQRVVSCLGAAIERRVVLQGVRLELNAPDRIGLLADVMRTFRENGLNVATAEVSTQVGTARNVFCVTDMKGNPPDAKTIKSVRERVGWGSLKVTE